jgi:hypothetical protein
MPADMGTRTELVPMFGVSPAAWSQVSASSSPGCVLEPTREQFPLLFGNARNLRQPSISPSYGQG